MDIKQVIDEQSRPTIVAHILRQLPDYFGVEESTLDYIHSSEKQVMFAAFEDDKPIGFITLKHHFASCVEVYAMGILKSHHHQGVGKQLMDEACKYALLQHYTFISVKTLGPSHPDEGYRKTRMFYKAMGFLPLEESKSFWKMDCPCLFMVKTL